MIKKELMGKHSVSCVIPAYNEERFLPYVLEAINDYPGFCEIIVMDNCSTDRTAEVASRYSNVTVVTNEVNLGKSGSVRKGINLAKGDVVVLLDADLRNLQHRHIDKMVVKVVDEGYDLVLSDRAGDRMSRIYGWTDCTRFMSGEKVFYKKDFLSIDFTGFDGYLFDIKLNMYFMDNEKRCYNYYFDDLFCATKGDKDGYWQGLKNYYKVSVAIIKAAGAKNYLKQFYFFETNRLPHLSSRLRDNRWRYVIIPAIHVACFVGAVLTTAKLNITRASSKIEQRTFS
ncbi:MAG: glycosyltransferase family 2 protein [Spirochaetales bacterium]|nr:glycosyltransferase family 2 protein [Spirochaetales bacterium]